MLITVKKYNIGYAPGSIMCASRHLRTTLEYGSTTATESLNISRQIIIFPYNDRIDYLYLCDNVPWAVVNPIYVRRLFKYAHWTNLIQCRFYIGPTNRGKIHRRVVYLY